AADSQDFPSIASTGATTSIKRVLSFALAISPIERGMAYSSIIGKFSSTQSVTFLIIVSSCSYSTWCRARNIVQGTCKLGHRCLCYCCQHGQCFVTRRQLGEAIDLVGTHQLTADGQGLDLERLLLFGEILQQARSGTRIFH